MNRKGDYLKQESRMMSVGNFAEALAGIAGGMLAIISLRTPFMVQSLVAFMAVPAAFLLVDVHHKNTSKKESLSVLAILKYAVISNKTLRWNIVLSSVIGSATLTFAWFVQPYLKDLDLEVSTIGIIWSLLNLTVGAVALLSHKVANGLGKTGTTLLIVIGISGGFIFSGLWHSFIGVAIFFVFYAVRGIATPVLKNYINELTQSHMRATVLSIRNFIIRICFALIAPFLGWYSDTFTLTTALILAGFVFLFLGSISVVMIYITERKKNLK